MTNKAFPTTVSELVSAFENNSFSVEGYDPQYAKYIGYAQGYPAGAIENLIKAGILLVNWEKLMPKIVVAQVPFFRKGDELAAAIQAHSETPNTLGIEITDGRFPSNLGNLDHHGDMSHLPTAVEQALVWELLLVNELNIRYQKLDLDTLAAIAVIMMRYKGIEITEEVRTRISNIAKLDSFGMGLWKGVRRLPKIGEQSEERLISDIPPGLGWMTSAREAGYNINQQIEKMISYLMTGEWDSMARDEAEAQKIWDAAVANSKIFAIETREQTAIRANLVRRGTKFRSGKIMPIMVFGEGTELKMTNIGYHVAPVLVLFNPKMKGSNGEFEKYTVTMFNDGYANSKEIQNELNALEAQARGITPEELKAQNATWGGQPNAFGSPFGQNSRLTAEQVVAVVQKHLIS